MGFERATLAVNVIFSGPHQPLLIVPDRHHRLTIVHNSGGLWTSTRKSAAHHDQQTAPNQRTQIAARFQDATQLFDAIVMGHKGSAPRRQSFVGAIVSRLSHHSCEFRAMVLMTPVEKIESEHKLKMTDQSLTQVTA
jgi:hypothetical protein